MMLTEKKFPNALLAAPIAKRLQYFQDKIIAHPHLLQVYQSLRQTIAHPAGVSLIFLFGPTGVGKTTLRLRLEKQLIEEAGPALEKEPGRVPVVGIEAIAQGADRFNWKDYYKRALLALDEPLLENKVDYQARDIYRDQSGHLVVKYSAVASDLRLALEQALRHRRLTAFVVDEAQHFQKLAGGRRLLDQMDSFKSLASLTDTLHVLIGTYDLLGLTDLSAQLCRRSVEISFPRYRADRPAEVEAFKSVILTLQSHLPLPEEPDLVRHYAYLYEGSVGCVGILKDWLSRALTTACHNDDLTLTLKHLDQHIDPPRQLLRMAREIKEGEALLQARDQQRTDLRQVLGMSPRSANDPQPSGRQRRVGERKPIRDEVGVNA
jgi:hypothetical protein